MVFNFANEQSNYEGKDASELKMSTRSEIYNGNRSFFPSLFLYTLSLLVEIFLFCHATLQHSIEKCLWIMERLVVDCFELFESLSFKSVEEVKIGSKRKD